MSVVYNNEESRSNCRLTAGKPSFYLRFPSIRNS